MRVATKTRQNYNWNYKLTGLVWIWFRLNFILNYITGYWFPYFIRVQRTSAMVEDSIPWARALSSCSVHVCSVCMITCIEPNPASHVCNGHSRPRVGRHVMWQPVIQSFTGTCSYATVLRAGACMGSKRVPTESHITGLPWIGPSLGVPYTLHTVQISMTIMRVTSRGSRTTHPWTNPPRTITPLDDSSSDNSHPDNSQPWQLPPRQFPPGQLPTTTIAPRRIPTPENSQPWQLPPPVFTHSFYARTVFIGN